MTTLQPGEINLDLIPDDWALTPIGKNKDPYIDAWTNHPFDKKQIQKELKSGRAKAVGLIAGNHYNNPFHLVWVDVDGESVWPVIADMSGTSDISVSLPPTLTILSGKTGRERKLYQVPKDKAKHLQRSKYITKPIVPNEKLEILCGNGHQGVLMGFHPETAGYFTKENEDFRYVKSLPELPDWILNFLRTKNLQRGKPESNHQRVYSPEFAVEVKVGDQRTLYEMEQALKHMAEHGHMDDYDMWITMGQAIHDFDDSLYDLWDKYSQASDKYDAKTTLDKWNSFGGGRGIGIGSLFHHAQEAGFQFNASAIESFSPSDDLLDTQEKAYTTFQSNDPMAQLLNNALKAAEQYEKEERAEQRENNGRRGRNNAPDNQLVLTLAQIFKGNIVFSTTHNNFMEYTKGYWRVLEKDEAEARVENNFYALVDSHLPKGWDNTRVVSVTKSLSRYLRDDNDWNLNPNLRCFNNVVVDITSRETFDHDKKYRLTNKIPYDYSPEADCPKIRQWLYDVQQNDDTVVQVLRAWLLACLVGAYDIQRFLEIVGPGKTGKSTFASLCTALVGLENTVATDFENLRSRFESARFIDSRLILFNDVERFAGDVSKFKAMTGGDPLRAEHKNSGTKIPPFIFKGLCIVTANEVIATTDSTSGLRRRRITIPFNKKFEGTANEQVQLISNKFTKDGSVSFGEFASELPGLINWLLEMPQGRMRSLLMDTEMHSTELKLISEAVDASTNLQKAWLADNVVFNPVGRHRFGRKIDNRDQDAKTPFKFWEDQIFPNYLAYAHSVSSSRGNAMGLMRFKAWLKDELENVLRINVKIYKERNVWYIEGISLRDSWPASGAETTISISQVPVPGNPNEQRTIKYAQDASGYAFFPTVQEASEDPDGWKKKFLEWAPSLKDFKILNN
jgi:P4 family phage/plasmid primase-like protien